MIFATVLPARRLSTLFAVRIYHPPHPVAVCFDCSFILSLSFLLLLEELWSKVSNLLVAKQNFPPFSYQNFLKFLAPEARY